MSYLLFATCEKYCVKIKSDTGRIWIMRNRRELGNILDTLPDEYHLTCSSGLDWPEDVTEDLNVIDVCNLIRGNSVRGDDIIAMHKANEK